MDRIKIREGESLRFDSSLDFDEMYVKALVYQKKKGKWIKARHFNYYHGQKFQDSLKLQIKNLAEYTNNKIFKFYPELGIGC